MVRVNSQSQPPRHTSDMVLVGLACVSDNSLPCRAAACMQRTVLSGDMDAKNDQGLPLMLNKKEGGT